MLGQIGGGRYEGGLCIVLGATPLGWRRPVLLEDGWDDDYAIVSAPMAPVELRAWAIGHGFDIEEELAGQDESWMVLTEMWQEQVRQRTEGHGGAEGGRRA